MISTETEYDKALTLLEQLYRKGRLSSKARSKRKKVEAQVVAYEKRCADLFNVSIEGS